MFDVGGATIVSDHRNDKEVSEISEYVGDRTPAPRFYFIIHTVEPAAFDEYRQSQARQDLLQMLRTLHIGDPPNLEEGVDLEDPLWAEE